METEKEFSSFSEASKYISSLKSLKLTTPQTFQIKISANENNERLYIMQTLKNKLRKLNPYAEIISLYLDLSESTMKKDIIKMEAFYRCHVVKGIVLPKSIKSIGEWTCGVCEHLEKVTLPEGLKRIGGYAFQECPKLKSIEIPASVINIGRNAFGESKSSPLNPYIDKITFKEEHQWYYSESKKDGSKKEFDPNSLISLISLSSPDEIKCFNNYFWYRKDSVF